MADYREFAGYQDGFIYRSYLPENVEGLAFIFHGKYSSAKKWTDRCRQIKEALPNVGVIAVQGPIAGYDPEDKTKPGYSWLDIGGLPKLVKEFAKHAVLGLKIKDDINKFIKARQLEYKLDASKVAVIGSSEGGIVALQAALANEENYGSVLGMATTVLPFTKTKRKADNSLKVDLFIGKEDEVFNNPTPEVKWANPLKGAFTWVANRLSYTQGKQTTNRLSKPGVLLSLREYQDTKHAVTDEMWKHSIGTVSRRLDTELKEDALDFAKSDKSKETLALK